MEARTSRIRRLQSLIAVEEAQKVILEKSNLYIPARQSLLDNLKWQLEYEKELELREINKPAIVQPAKKNWQDSIPRYILVGVIIAVIAIIISAVILSSGSSLGK